MANMWMVRAEDMDFYSKDFNMVTIEGDMGTSLESLQMKLNRL